MNRKIIIFGAGRYGRQLKRMLESEHVNTDQKWEICFWCDNKVAEGSFVDGVEVLHPTTIKRTNINFDIVISVGYIADCVMKQLKELNVTNNVYLVPEYVYKFKWNHEDMPFMISMDISKPRMPYLECKIVEHCNLKCNGCSTCSNISETNYMEIEEFEQNLVCLRRLFTGIKNLKLFGGEPLLHPQLIRFMEVARKHFPDAELVVHSNGVLVPSMAERILESMKKLDIKFIFTLYPETGKRKRNIEEKLNKWGVEHTFTEPVYEFRKIINSKGNYDAKEVFQNCGKCINLVEGTISCGIGYFIDKIEKAYDVNICEDKFQHCIDIHATDMTGWEINELLDSPFNLCKYCAFMRFNVIDEENYYYKWKTEEPKLEDWVF